MAKIVHLKETFPCEYAARRNYGVVFTDRTHGSLRQRRLKRRSLELEKAWRRSSTEDTNVISKVQSQMY